MKAGSVLGHLPYQVQNGLFPSNGILFGFAQKMPSINEVVPSCMGGWKCLLGQLAQRRVLSQCPFTLSMSTVLTVQLMTGKCADPKLNLSVDQLIHPTPNSCLLCFGKKWTVEEKLDSGES